MTDTRRLAAASGVVSAVGTPTSILVATLIAPWFSWRADALSDLGVTAGTAVLFNGTLLGGGALAVPFAWLLWTTGAGSLARLRAGSFAVTAVALGAVGLFPAGHSLHFPVAVTHFLGVSVTLVVDWLARPRTTTGRLAGIAGLGNVAGWLAWGQGLLVPGLAVPEFLGALLFASWVALLSPVTPLTCGGGERHA